MRSLHEIRKAAAENRKRPEPATGDNFDEISIDEARLAGISDKLRECINRSRRMTAEQNRQALRSAGRNETCIE